MKSKKGSEMAFSTIVTAAIAVVVMVVVIILLTNKFHIFGEGTNKCGGRCVSPDECSPLASSKMGCPENEVCCNNFCEDNEGRCDTKCGDDEVKSVFYKCSSKDQVCCLKR